MTADLADALGGRLPLAPLHDAHYRQAENIFRTMGLVDLASSSAATKRVRSS